MATNETRRLAPAILRADVAVYAALQNIPGYAPAKADFAPAKIKAASDRLASSQAGETQAKGAWDAARDGACAAEWAFHNLMLGVKDQVKAQFGADSDEWQALGQKKKSEYKKPPGRPRNPPPAK